MSVLFSMTNDYANNLCLPIVRTYLLTCKFTKCFCNMDSISTEPFESIWLLDCKGLQFASLVLSLKSLIVLFSDKHVLFLSWSLVAFSSLYHGNHKAYLAFRLMFQIFLLYLRDHFFMREGRTLLYLSVSLKRR